LEPDGGAVLRSFSAKEQVVEFAGLGVGHDLATGFDGFFNAS
jgi:hypothetical protein